MIAVTSAKSRLTTPGIFTRSEMLCTPCLSTLSAAEKAFWRVIFSSEISLSRSFGMTSSASTCSRSAVTPISACSIRRRPSKLNGLVTMPTVSTPISCAISATTGAPPVPVPPPIPAVINTISVPLSAAAISSRLSSAARWPFSGLPPAPLPRVSLSPICSL